MLQKKMNMHVLPRIAQLTGDENIKLVEFFWKDIGPGDELRQSQLHTSYSAMDAMTQDEIRADLDLDPLPHGLGRLTHTAFSALVTQDPLVLMRETAPDLTPPPTVQEQKDEEERMRAEEQERMDQERAFQEEQQRYTTQ